MDRTGQITLGDRSGNPRDPFDFSLLPNGLSDLPISVTYTGNQARTETAQGTLHVYQQPYSVVFGTVFTTDTGNEFIERPGDANIHDIEDVLGYRTPDSALNGLIAQNAVFNYSGVAFNGIDQGQLNYRLDFGKREGSGTITGITQTGRIDLLPALLNLDGSLEGRAQIEKMRGVRAEYELELYGPNAEEIAGDVEIEGVNGVHDIGFGGRRD